MKEETGDIHYQLVTVNYPWYINQLKTFQALNLLYTKKKKMLT